jgi:hypothetical protein
MYKCKRFSAAVGELTGPILIEKLFTYIGGWMAK